MGDCLIPRLSKIVPPWDMVNVVRIRTHLVNGVVLGTRVSHYDLIDDLAQRGQAGINSAGFVFYDKYSTDGHVQWHSLMGWSAW